MNSVLKFDLFLSSCFCVKVLIFIDKWVNCSKSKIQQLGRGHNGRKFSTSHKAPNAMTSPNNLSYVETNML